MEKLSRSVHAWSVFLGVSVLGVSCLECQCCSESHVKTRFRVNVNLRGFTTPKINQAQLSSNLHVLVDHYKSRLEQDSIRQCNFNH